MKRLMVVAITLMALAVPASVAGASAPQPRAAVVAASADTVASAGTTDGSSSANREKRDCFATGFNGHHRVSDLWCVLGWRSVHWEYV